MIVDGTLGGYWRRAGSRMIFTIYLEDLELYFRKHGPLNKQRRDRKQGAGAAVGPGPSATADAALVWNEAPSLRASLIELEARVSALERASAGSRRNDRADRLLAELNAERRRRLELQDALSALEEDDVLVSEAEELNRQAFEKLRLSHHRLRTTVLRTRAPRTADDVLVDGPLATQSDGEKEIDDLGPD